MVKLDKKIIIFLVFVVVLGFSGLVKADELDWVTGWAWSENIGWISFNCYNYYDGDATNLESHCTDAGYATDYGVDLDYDNPSGNKAYFSGYAWSENIGWISFNEADLVGCPDGTCKAWVSLVNNRLYGWAKALNTDGGWDGWIRLKGEIDAGGDYGVQIDDWTNPFQFLEWAYGGDDDEEEAVIGWISVNCSNSGVCGDSFYKMITEFTVNLFPEVTDTNVTELDYCCALVPPVILNWTFLDQDLGDYQTAYQIQLDDVPGLSTPRGCPLEEDLKVSTGGENPHSCLVRDLLFNETYYWQAKVWDSKDDDSIYESGPSFTTGPIYPCPGFICNGQNCEGLLFEEDEIITFTNQTLNCDPCIYSWDFGDGVGVSSDVGPIYSYPAYGEYTVSLTATDGINHTCPVTHTFTVVAPIPKWREIEPF